MAFGDGVPEGGNGGAIGTIGIVGIVGVGGLLIGWPPRSKAIFSSVFWSLVSDAPKLSWWLN